MADRKNTQSWIRSTFAKSRYELINDKYNSQLLALLDLENAGTQTHGELTPIAFSHAHDALSSYRGNWALEDRNLFDFSDLRVGGSPNRS